MTWPVSKIIKTSRVIALFFLLLIRIKSHLCIAIVVAEVCILGMVSLRASSDLQLANF